MAKKRKRPGWTCAIGEAPHLLSAFERADRGNAIYTRIWDGRSHTAKQRLCGPIRDEKNRIVPELELAARAAATKRQADSVRGIDTRPNRGPLTLEAGFDKLLNQQTGKYAGNTEWRDEVERYSKVIIDVLKQAAPLWKDLKHAHYRQLWRHMANEHVANGTFGLRACEMIVGALQTCARWLQQEELIDVNVQPKPGWRAAMKADWVDITKKPAPKPKRLRHTVDDFGKLWEKMPEADPRIALALEIGAELRLGQVVARTRRSDVLPYGGFRIGAVQVHGKGKKGGALVVLTMLQRHAVVRAGLRGYLSGLERAYQRKEIADYFLIQGGRLLKGKAQAKNADTPLSRKHLGKLWKDLEKLSGVEHVTGRAAYGVRRLQADRAEDVTSDARELNMMGGWSNTKTRELYQDEGRPEVAVGARNARAKIRPK